MKKSLRCATLALTIALGALPAFAVDGSEVLLHASTVAGAAVGATGQFDFTVPDQLVFHASGKPDLAMPYAQIVEFSSRDQRTHKLGVLLTIIVGLLAPFEHQHFITISYRDNAGIMQLATFEVGKTEPDTIVSVLQTKARNACERREYGSCSPVVPAAPAQPRRLLDLQIAPPAPPAAATPTTATPADSIPASPTPATPGS